jgi:hypothetical protein
MKQSNALVILSGVVLGVAAVAAVVGLFWMAGPGPFSFTTLHGQTVAMYGRGLYQFDTAVKAPVYRGSDAVLLCLGVPLVAVALWLYRRGSLRGGLLLAGGLLCFLYNGASLVLGAAYNVLYPLYLVYFSAGFFAFVLALTAIDLPALPGRILPGMPHRALAVFIMVAGLSPCVWLISVVSTLVSGLPAPDSLTSYTTDVTTALDVGLITPACFLAGALLLRRKPLGYVLTGVLLTLLTLIGFIVVGQTVVQLLDGVKLTAGEIAAFVVPFVTLGLIAIGFLTALLRHVADRPA